jgi:M6 family metalloprotease-like protein
MVFVDFGDAVGSEAPADLFQRFVPRATSWTKEVSYGRLTLRVDQSRRWHRMPRPSRDYRPESGFTQEEQAAYLRDAIGVADDSVDFSHYDAVYVVPARGSGLYSSTAYNVPAGEGIRVDGTELLHAVSFGDDTRVGGRPGHEARVLIHETGHLLGLPDLYDTSSALYPHLSRFAGGWDVMSSYERAAVHLFAWHKWKLGWLARSQLRCLDGPGSVDVLLAPLARPRGVKAVVVPTGTGTALVVEARRRILRDSALCEEGVLVYSVNATIRSGQGPIRVRAAQRDRNGGRVWDCGATYEAPLDKARGEVAQLVDAQEGIRVTVLGRSRTGYRIRVTRR